MRLNKKNTKIKKNKKATIDNYEMIEEIGSGAFG